MKRARSMYDSISVNINYIQLSLCLGFRCVNERESRKAAEKDTINK